MGGFHRPELAVEHFKYIADATDLPLIAFVYPVQSNLHFTFEGLVQLFDEVPSVKAIKDWCNDPKLHERHIREFQSRASPVNVLTTHSSWLMSSLVLGAAGLLPGLVVLSRHFKLRCLKLSSAAILVVRVKSTINFFRSSKLFTQIRFLICTIG